MMQCDGNEFAAWWKANGASYREQVVESKADRLAAMQYVAADGLLAAQSVTQGGRTRWYVAHCTAQVARAGAAAGVGDCGEMVACGSAQRCAEHRIGG